MMFTNIRHLTDGATGTELPGPALKLRTYLGHIIQAATSEEHAEFLSGIPCRRRVNRKPCPGLIDVKRTDVPGPYIFWSCDYCGEQGRISDFVGSWYDLSRYPSTLGGARDADEQRINVELTHQEFAALISGDHIPYDPDSLRLIYSATAYDDGVDIIGWEGDLDVLRDAVAADANHEKGRKRQKLVDSVFRKLSDALDATLDQRGA